MSEIIENPSLTSLEANSNLIFIDSHINNYQTLLPTINNAEVVILDSSRDGIEQITEILATRNNLQSIHILSHGNDGELQLGRELLTTENLDDYSEHIQTWGNALTESADIFLYGCNVAATDLGVDFITQLSNLTTADIAASNDLTGETSLGGDWDLEVATGNIATQSFSLTNYQGILVTYNGNEYIISDQALTWQQAQAEAVRLGGNLVTINDAAEQTWLRDTFGGTERLWIGLTDRATEGQFRWESGESLGYTNWANGQPNNFGAGEDFVAFLTDGKWNDIGGGARLRAIIEIGDDNSSSGETFTYNGKEYLLTSATSSWQQAQAEAVRLGGNLVTINDAAEQTWLRDTFGGTERLWIGLTDRATEGQFRWESGESLGYTNWANGQPNNFGAGEDFVAFLTGGKWNDIGGGARLRGIIELDGGNNNNSGVIGLETNNYRVNEGDGTVQVTILRTQGSDGQVTVDYRTVNSSAVAGQDYRSRSGTVNFAAGETRKSITIPILEDNQSEGNETFGFAIDNVTGGATLLAPRTATITIQDNDTQTVTYNGNQYLLTSALTWQQAQTEAERLGGNLVTINDVLEENWLKDTFGRDEGFWIGLNDTQSEGNFRWVSGQPVSYTNWAAGEPNNGGGNQDFGWMNYGSTKQWDDSGSSTTFRGIVEIGGSNGTSGQGNGLRGEYFDNIDFTNSRLVRTDRTVNFDWGNGSPAPAIASDTFSVRWTGQVEPLYSENYTFRTTTDDGVRLWINNQLIINQFIDQSPTNHNGSITLQAGQKYDIRLEYYENGGGAVSQLSWSSPSQPLQIIPQSQLYSPPVDSRSFNQETIISGLDFPTSVEWTPDGDIMFVAEQGGIIKVFENGTLRSRPFVNISDQVNGTRDRGLLDIAVHPDFFNGKPYVYALYTYDPPQVLQNSGLAGPDGNGNRAARLTRFTADASTNYTTAVPGSEVILLGKNSTWDNFNAFANSTVDFNEPPAGILPDGTNIEDFLAADSESHTIGSVEFGTDGALYVSNGDGTSYNRVDPRTVRVQDIDNLSGKILRIDPITGKGLSDNPFYNGNADANRSKVYQYGLRNPFRFTVHPQTGQVYVGDVGWTTWEEVNAGGAGANFGWPYYEGGSGNSLRTGGYQDLSEAQAFYASGQSVTSSIFALNHSADGINAIVMGDVYTGNTFPEEYRGDLFINDLGRGIVRNLTLDNSGRVIAVDTFATNANVVVQINQGPDGNLYYVDLDDGIVGRWEFV